MKILSYLKSKYKDFISDLKYDRELNKTYRKANKVIKEAVQRCRIEGRQFYVLPDPNSKGEFFCISPKERLSLVKLGVLKDSFDGVFMIKNAIFIAKPNGNHVRRKLTIPKEWLLQK